MIKIELPVSKSEGARFLVATYFAGTLPADPYFEDNDDLLVLQQALLEIYSDEEPIDYGNTPIDVHASGTAMRLVTAVCASSPGADYVVMGTPRLCSRPMAPLLKVLREAGAEIATLGENGCGPYRVTGKKLKGGEFSIEGNISSQFITALMLVAPTWEEGMTLRFTTPLVSRPYIDMTARLMEQFGIKPELSDEMVTVKPGKYKEPEGIKVETDWSSASFFYEACSMGSGEMLLEALRKPEDSLQGDSVCAELFAKLGVKTDYSEEGVVISEGKEKETYIEKDMKDCPDLVLPYAVACQFSGVKYKFTGVGNLRLKESDRLKSLKEESRKLGFVVETGDDTVEWKGETVRPEDNPLISTYEDHRVAMTFAMAALKTGHIRIEDPDVVEKSFGLFWEQLGNLPLKYSREGNIMLVERCKEP